MLSHDEKERLLLDMPREPAWAVGVVLKCAACLLMVAVLAWIGIRTDPGPDAALTLGPPAAGAPAPHHERASVVEARKVFEERRVRFNGQSTGSQTQAAR